MIAHFIQSRVVHRLNPFGKTILIFGARKAGKTTIFHALLQDTPYRVLQ